MLTVTIVAAIYTAGIAYFIEQQRASLSPDELQARRELNAQQLTENEYVVWTVAIGAVVDLLLMTRLLFRRRRAAVAMGLLVGLVSFIFVCANWIIWGELGGGPFGTTQEQPNAADLCWYTVTQLFHVGDVLDVVREYGWDIDNLRPSAPISQATLIAFNVLIGVNLIAFFGSFLLHWLPASRAPRWRVWTWRLTLLYVTGLLVAWCAYEEKWSRHDCGRWPVDNALRTIDFADAMQIVQVRLHDVPPTTVNNTLAILFRFTVGFFLLAIFQSLRLLMPGSLVGHTTRELLEMLTSGRHTALARWQLTRRLRLSRNDVDRVTGDRTRSELAELWSDITEPSLRRELLVLLADAAPHCNEQGARSLRRAILSALDDPDAETAAAALQSFARPGVLALLLPFLANIPTATFHESVDKLQRVFAALKEMGPKAIAAVPALVELIEKRAAPLELVRAAALALKRIDPKEWERLRASSKQG